MLEKFKKEVIKNKWQKGKIVAAVSGGADSMCMADLLLKAGMEIVIAHVNYQLRKEESDLDEDLVRTWAKQNNVRFYLLKIDLKQELDEKGGNLQEKARDYRYEFFQKIRKELKYDWIATAHHQSDSVESMLINFFKGTGIGGMQGISLENNKVIRPLLYYKKEEIDAYILKESVPWRLDKSNLNSDYVRNKIRNQVVPLLKEIFPQVEQNLAHNILRFNEFSFIYEEAVQKAKNDLLEKRNEEWYIPVLKLKKYKARQTILFEVIKDYGFESTQMPFAMHLLDAGPGKFIQSKTHRLIKDRDFLILTALPTLHSTFIVIKDQENLKEIKFPGGTLKFNIQVSESYEEIISKSKNLEKKEVFISFDEIQFPIILRPWKQGDYFYPLGMRKKKKVSRFLIDQKIPLAQKEKIWVLESDKKIFWIVGMRIDERFKLEKKTQVALKISLKNE